MADIDMENRIAKLEDKYNALDKDEGILSVLFQKSLETTSKLSSTIEKLGETISELKNAMSSMQTEIKDTMEQVCETRKEIEYMKTSIRNVEEKGKIDWLEIIKQNLIKFILGGGFVVTIIVLGTKLIDALAK